MTDRMDLRDEERLPWLETVEPDDEPRGGAARSVALGVMALVLVALVVAGIALWRNNRAAGGDGALIAAQGGDYKVRPDDPGGLKVEGEGEAAVAASGGGSVGDAAVDLKAVPEAPVAATGQARSKADAAREAGRNAVAAVPGSGGRLVAAPPMGASRLSGGGSIGGGSIVQLGAYPSEAAANTAWGAFAKRFSYLAPLGKSVEKAEVNGRTVYRLRVNAGSANQASDLVAKLRIAGEQSFVTG